MSEILTSRPGILAAVNQIGVPGFVKIGILGAFGIPMVSTSAIIQSINGNLLTNTQFQHALDQNVYVYSFGDRMGQAQVSGLAFESDCFQVRMNLENPITGGGILTGLDQVMAFYKLNRVSLLNRPVIVVAGTISILRGYLTGLNFGTRDTANKTTAWTLNIATLPGSDVLGLL